MAKDEGPRNTAEEGGTSKGRLEDSLWRKEPYWLGPPWSKDPGKGALERNRTPRSTNHEFEDAQLKWVPDC